MVEIDTTLHIGEVAFSYYQVQRSVPEEEDFIEWVQSMQEPEKRVLWAGGLEKALEEPEFLRFFAQIRDREMKSYMKQRLSKEEYCLWLTYRHGPT